jgi:tRNA-dihydrouridine synthase B
MPSPINLAELLNVGGVELRNRVFLAPLSGITDVCFRQRAYAHGAGLVVSEMIASGELVKGSSESIRRTMGFGQGVRMVQLAGRNPAPWRKARASLKARALTSSTSTWAAPQRK